MLRRGLGAALAELRAMEPDLPLQFEADPYTWGVACCATEEPVTEGDWLDESLPADWYERAEAAGIDWIGARTLLEREICQWFADCWHAEGGPARFSPAYLFLHDYHDQQYDLERRCWVSAAEAFPGG
jgi:hypothetical protein